MTREAIADALDGLSCTDLSNAMDRLCIQVSFPIFSRGTWMRTGKDRVRVMQGDWLRGDGVGVVAIPASRIEEVIASPAKSTEQTARFARPSMAACCFVRRAGNSTTTACRAGQPNRKHRHGT